MIPKILRSAYQYIFGNSSTAKKGVLSEKFHAMTIHLSALFSKKKPTPTASHNQLNPKRVSIQKEGLSAYIQKKSQPKKPLGFFSKIAAFFTPLFSFLGVSNAAAIEEERLKYTLKLFKNEDETLIEQLSSKEDLPFSSLLRFWNNSLQETLIYQRDPFNKPEFKAKLKLFIDLQRYQEKLESIQKSRYSFFKRISCSLLQSEIQRKLYSLKKDQSIFIPCGNYGSGVHQTSICEITKNSESSYTCRIFDLSKSVVSSTKKNRESIESVFHCSREHIPQFVKTITDSLTEKIPPISVLKGGKRSGIGIIFHLFTGVFRGSKSYPEGNRLENFLKSHKITSNPAGMTTEKNPRGDSNYRLLSIFIKAVFQTTFPEQKAILREEKLLVRGTNLLKLSQDLTKQLYSDDASGKMFRSWMKRNIESLEKSLHKIEEEVISAHLFNSNSLITLRSNLQQLGESIYKYDQKPRKAIPTEIEKLVLSDKPQICTKETLLSISKIVVQGLTPATSIQLDRSQIQILIEKSDTAAIEKAIQELEMQREKREFTAVKAQTREIFFAFRAVHDHFPAETTSPDFIKLIQRLEFLLIQSNWGLGHFSPNHEDLLMILSSLQLQDQILRLSTKHRNIIDSYVEGYRIDIQPLLDWVSSDPFFSFDSSTLEISKIKKYFDDLDKKPIDLLEVRPNDERSESNIFFKSYSSKNVSHIFDPHEKLPGPIDVGSGRVQRRAPPPEFFHLRQSLCLAHACINLKKALSIPLSDGIKIILEDDDWDKTIFGPHQRGKIADKIGPHIVKKLEEASSKTLSITTRKRAPIIGALDIAIGPIDVLISNLNYGLYSLGWDDSPTSPSFAQKNGVEISKEMSRTLYHNRVAPKLWGDEPESPLTYWYKLCPRFEHEILRGIANEEIPGLSKQLQAQLQLCSTDPKASRFANILGFMQENIGLINDAKIGPSLGRFFETTLFDFLFLADNRQVMSSEEDIQLLIQHVEQLAEQTIQSLLLDGSIFLFGTLLKLVKLMPENRSLSDTVDRIEVFLRVKCQEPIESKAQILEALLLRQADRYDLSPESIGEAQSRSVIRDLFEYRSIASKSEWRNPVNEERLELFSRRIKLPKEKIALCTMIIGKEIDGWTSSDGIIWKTKEYQIDFSQFQILKNGHRATRLPIMFAQSSQFIEAARLIQQFDSSSSPANDQWSAQPILHESKNGVMYELKTTNENFFRIIQKSGSADFALYHKREHVSSKESIWYQYLAPIDSLVPDIFRGNEAWIDEQKSHILIEKSGKLIWKASIQLRKEGIKIDGVEDAQTKQQIAIGPFVDQSIFSVLDSSSAIIALKESVKTISSIRYLRLGLEYSFNRTTKRWDAHEIKGYILSAHSLNSLASTPSAEDAKFLPYKKLAHLFNSSFDQYHILEEKYGTKNPILLLPGTHFESSVLKTAPSGYVMKPSIDDIEACEKVLFQFELDPIKGIISKKEPEGYLYLSYCLLAQGNIKDAFFYLSKLTNGNRSSLFREILSWSLSAVRELVDSPEKRALLFRYAAFLQMHHLPFPTRFPKIEEAIAQFEEIRGSLPSHFSLTKNELSIISQEIHFKEKQNLRLEIEKIHINRLSTPRQEDHASVSQSLFQGTRIEPLIQNYLNKLVEPHQNLESVEDPFHTNENNLDSLSLEIRNEMRSDFRFFTEQLHQQKFQFNRTADIKNTLLHLEKDISFGKFSFQQALQEERQQIFSLCIEECDGGNNQKSFQEILKLNGTEDNNQLFDNLLHSFGEDDFSQYIGDDLLLQEELKKKIFHYLLLSIQYRHIDKIENLLLEIRRSKKELSIHTIEKLFSLLKMQQHYDPKNDPFREAFLLIEYRLEIVCRKEQIEEVKKQLSTESLFSHKACGMGKTSLLTPTILALLAKKGALAIASTLSSVMPEHGPRFEQTTKIGFGQEVLKFQFSRSSRSDAAALLQLYLDLLQTVHNRGRVQLSKKDLQCFSLTSILKMEEASKKSRVIELLQKQISLNKIQKEQESLEMLMQEHNELHKEIDIMHEIMSFMRQSAFLIADELDKETDISEELNFAIGSMKSTCMIEKKGLIELFRTIFTEQEKSLDLKFLAKAIENNQLSDLDIEKKRAGLDVLARIIAENSKTLIQPLQISVDDLAHYLRRDSEIAQTVYLRLKRASIPEIQMLLYQKNFLSQILEEALSKRCRVDYGVSSERAGKVIPYIGSDTPRENSEHSNPAEKLVYTCLYYLTDNFSLEQAKNELASIRNQAIRQQQELLQTDPTALGIFLNAVPVAKAWCEEFGIDTADFADITPLKFIESLDSLKKLQLIEQSIFSTIKTAKEKLTSNAQDLVAMVKSYSGFSGTDMTAQAMPDKICRKESRQKGAYGEIISALVKSQKSTLDRTFLPLTGSETAAQMQETLTELLAKNMKWGDCLSDVGCFYPGISALEIAQMLLKAIKSQSATHSDKYIWFIDRSGRWNMLSSKGIVMNGDEAIPLKNRITLFDDIHTRGTDRPSVANATVYVTISSDARWTEFEQGIMRERGLTFGNATVRYILAPSLAKKIEALPDLFDHCIFNESKRLKPLFFKAERQKIAHILREGVRSVSLALATDDSEEWNDQEKYQAQEIIHRETRSLFFLPNEIDALQAGKPLEEECSSDHLNRCVEVQIALLDQFSIPPHMNLSPGCIRYLTQFFDLLKERTKPQLEAKRFSTESSIHPGRIEEKYLPLKIKGSITQIGQTEHIEIEVEVEQETEVETEVEVQVEVEQIVDKNLLELANEIDLPDIKPETLHQNSIQFHRFNCDLSIPKSLDSKNKYYTENFFPGEQTPWSHYRNPIQQTLFVIPDQSIKPFEIIGSRRDVDRYFMPYKADDSTIFWVQNYSLGSIPKRVFNRLNPLQALGVMEEMIKTKLLNLDVSFLDHAKESDSPITKTLGNYYEGLCRFLRETYAENVKELIEFEQKIRTNILRLRPDISYQGSSLQKAIQQIIQEAT